MSIVIAGGSSVNDYPQKNLMSLCLLGFTFAVNRSAFYFPCDVVVWLDPFTEYIDRLKKLNKPIISMK